MTKKPLRKTGHFVRVTGQAKNRTDFCVRSVRFSKKHAYKPDKSRAITGQNFLSGSCPATIKKPDGQDKTLGFVRSVRFVRKFVFVGINLLAKITKISTNGGVA